MTLPKFLVAASAIFIADAAFAVTPAACDANFSSTGQTACTFTPDSLKVSVYKFALCQTKPSYNNFPADCAYFLDEVTPVDFTVSVGSGGTLSNNLTIEPGSYPYVAMVWDKEIALSYTSPAYTVPQFGADGVSGTYCYSNGNARPNIPNTASARNVTCTNNQADAIANRAPSVQEITNLGTTNQVSNMPSISGTFDSALLSSPTTLATVTAYSASSNGTTATYHTSDAQYLFSVLTLSNPPVIDENTTGLDWSILLTDAAIQEVYYNIPVAETTGTGTWCNGGIQSGSNYSCLGNVQLESLGFKFTVR